METFAMPVMDMLQLTRDLERDEGRRRKPYTDTAGKLTIGVGRNLTDNGLSEPEIDMLLDHDLIGVCADLDRNIPWWRDMPEPWQRGLANMGFMGWPTLSRFVLMLRALETGDGKTAAAEVMDSAYARQVGARAARISKLFKMEA